MNKAKIIILIIIVLTFLVLIYKTYKSCYTIDDNSKDEATVYGTDTCPHCINIKKKYNDQGVKYKFVDCSKEKCPDFVEAYPTIQFSDGTIKVGDA